MIELKDECWYCGKKKEEHDPFNNTKGGIVGYSCREPFMGYVFKSTTQYRIEINAVRNLELLIQVHHLLNEKITSSFLDSQDMIELENMVEQLYIAIKQSTE